MEPTSTLADALLEDLDDLSDIEAQTLEIEGELVVPVSDSGDALSHGQGEGQKNIDFLHNNFLENPHLQKHLEAIRTAQVVAKTKEEREEEHYLVVQSNKYLIKLTEHLEHTHGLLCAAYKAKFPELEEIIPNPLQYTKAIRVIGNEMDMTKVSEKLSDFLTSKQIITLSVAGSTTAGRTLSDDELLVVADMASRVEQITNIQEELIQYIESRMEGLAPSVCALVGSSVAAKMIGLAGGLAELSKIPACNLQVLGQVRQNATSRAGFSSVHTKPHQGVLSECDLVQRCPQHLQKKALKTVAAKLALATRFDFINVDTGRTRSASSGVQLRSEIEEKIEKWQEPDKAPTLKALPKPDLTTKKRRGGKRMRRLKERFDETEMMKQANTRGFASQAGEYGDDAMGLTMGLLDTAEVAAGGSLRKVTEKRKMKYANTKASRKKSALMNATAASSGLASSMIFTPVQGMELVNPDASKERIKEANRKWFADHAGFQSAIPKSKK